METNASKNYPSNGSIDYSMRNEYDRQPSILNGENGAPQTFPSEYDQSSQRNIKL